MQNSRTPLASLPPRRRFYVLSLLFIASLLAACNFPAPSPQVSTIAPESPAAPTTPPTPAASPTPTPPPPSLLSVCLGQEPLSLFLYGDASPAARLVRSAIYDGPVDTPDYDDRAVILQNIPASDNGGVSLESIQVAPGTTISDQAGGLGLLQEGAAYLPAGCREAGCAAAYTGSDPANMDQMVVRFKLLPGLKWSDGQALTADDSLYSYEIARALFPRYRPELLRYTASYTVVDETTVEWRGVPGYVDALYRTFFFTPLPRHAWGSLTAADLPAAEVSSRLPLGWGAFFIEEWSAGDHISLARNPAYHRAAEGLPYYDRLVFRFVNAGSEALAAFSAGECDILDESALAGADPAALAALKESGSAQVISGPGQAWELVTFGIQPADPGRVSILKSREVRQALAQCLDRPTLAEQLFGGEGQALQGYIPSTHPLFAADAPHPAYDPQAAADLLTSAGWLDSDQDASTPRLSLGVPGVPDGTPLELSYTTIAGSLRQQAAEWVKASLAQCGFSIQISLQSRDEVFAPGPDGKVFGRSFDLAQFAWTTAPEPPCFLFTSAQIPGPYPDFANGWGGGNASGYSNPAFDAACDQARASLPGSEAYNEAQNQAQVIFAEDLPALPLYIAPRRVLARPELCGLGIDPGSDNLLWNLENFAMGEACTR